MASIGSLTADLKLESAAFVRDLKKASDATARSTASMQRSMATMQRGFSAAGAAFKGVIAGFLSLAAVRSFISLRNAAIEAGNEISDAATRIGIGAEDLQRLRFASQQTGVEVAQLDKALSMFAQNLAKGEISAEGASMAEAFRNYIDSISEAPTQLEKVRIAQEAFGKQWQTAMLLAAQGAEEFKRQADSAFVVSDRALRVAGELDNQFREFSNAVSAGFQTGLLERFGESLGRNRDLTQQSHEAAETFGRIAAGVYTRVTQVVVFMANAIEGAKGQIDAMKASLLGLLGIKLRVAPPELPDFESFRAELGLATPAVEQFNVELGVGTVAAEKNSQALSKVSGQLAAINQQTIQASQLQSANAAAQGYLEAIPPLQQYQLEIKRLMELQAQGAITAAQFGQAQAMAAATAIAPWMQVAGTIGQALGTLFEDNKAVAIAQAIINTLQGITAAIAQYPPPLSYAMAAAQAALGFAQVAKIKSTQPGSSGGGSGTGKKKKGKGFQVGGLVSGSGIGDKVQALLEPKEFVVNRNAAGRFRPLLEEINASPSRFANGGSVGGGRTSGMAGLGGTVNLYFQKEIVTDDIGFTKFTRRIMQEIDRQQGRRKGRRAF